MPRGSLKEMSITPVIHIETNPPTHVENDPLALEAYNKLLDIVQTLLPVTPGMIYEISEFSVLEAIKKRCLQEIDDKGYLVIDSRGRPSQNPCLRTYLQALDRQRQILRDLSVIAKPSGEKTKTESLFKDLLDGEEF